MATLIVDDEEETRKALRLLLEQLGEKTVIEAKDGEEALHMLDKERAKVRLIISDFEMPRLDGVAFADRIQAREELSLAPFLLITSDLTDERKEQILKDHPRIDYAIAKPFRLKIFQESIQLAFARRARFRDELLFLSPSPPPPALIEVIGSVIDSSLLRKITVDPKSKKFGAVVLLPGAGGPDPEIITSLKKSSLGAAASWFCLSRDPAEIGPFHGICHQYLNPSPFTETRAWDQLLRGVTQRLLNSWEIDRLTQEAKALVQKKKAEAAEAVERLLMADPLGTDARLWLADLAVLRNDLSQAIVDYRAALHLNPLIPKAHLKLLELVPKAQGLLRAAEEAREAVRFCAANPEVLALAAGVFSAAGKHDEAVAALESARKLNPKLEGLQELEERIAIARK
jgi:two-component system chemotaxis response regulator CheY